jgi:mevalonate kinase
MGNGQNHTYKEVIVPGRICLLGDKIDLMGLPVIAAAIDTCLTVKARKLENFKVKMYSEKYKSGLEYTIGEKGDWEHYLKYWCAMIYRLRDKIGGFEAIVESNIPVGAGLSSSAAISVALAKTLNELYNLGLERKGIAELAYQAEHDDLQIMCGRMDQYSISFGGVTYIETGESPSVQSLKIDNLPVVVGDSQEERQSKTVLNNVKRRLNENDPVIHNAFNIIHQGVLEGRVALEKNDYEKVGELMNIQQQQENIVGAATKKLNKLCKASLEAGALGAKQMGAGGGGCIVACAPGKQEKVAEAIENAGGKAWIFNIFNY